MRSIYMDGIIEQYSLGGIQVTVTQTGLQGRYHISCKDDKFQYEFKASKDEYESYKHLMNKRIKNAFIQHHGA